MAKLKVSELPIEEQQALVQEAKELGIGGLILNYGVETLKDKIAKLEAEQNGKKEDGDKKPQEDNKKDEKQKPVSEAKAKEEAKKDVKYKICHICRSKVINGVCTGCGYTLNP